ncbi:ATPase [Parapedobacter defluvii]|uniref:ATPase n=1 Tax=Parapedobacter defluvii TaxID=2045106 RepID=A0ABQ1MDK6_9SPHI|nr:ATP-binding protein [Parapedobacter defluvii]GGC38769.1 ATPase [Parapedobacter defluvii]
MKFYNRRIFDDLKAHLPKRQITVLTGMRRTGKTTLVRQLLSESGIKQQFYFDLERIDNRVLFAEQNYEHIVRAFQQQGADLSKPLLVAIDEIQLVPNLPSVLKYLYDNYPIKFIVTGSSSFYIKNLFSESLAGRKKIFEVYPLNFHELLAFNGLNAPNLALSEATQFVASTYQQLRPYYEEYIQYGGFPEVVLEPSVEGKKDLLQDILSAYINFDISALSDIRNPANLYKLIKLLSVRTGSRLDVSKLTSIAGISRPTVENYLYLLENSYLIRTIPVLTASPDREITKARKIYFLDNGIASAVGELSSGAKFENAVFNQLLHRGDVAYYQLKNGKEIDFIVNKEYALEVKETAVEADLKQVRDLAANLGINACYVVGRDPVKQFPAFIWGGYL